MTLNSVKKPIVFICILFLSIVFFLGCADNENSRSENDHPDSYYIKWAVPRQSVQADESRIDKINEKLEKDGYGFGLKLILLDDLPGEKSYLDGLYSCGADIVFTGFEGESDKDGNYINNSEEGMIQGRFECLDSYLEGSELFLSRPELFWDRVLYNGSIYLIPSEILQPGGELVLYNNDFPLKGDICTLIRCVDDSKRLFYGLTGFSFMDCMGFYYDELKGIVTDNAGIVINPFEVGECEKWLKTLNNIYKNGYLVTNDSSISQREACDIRFPDTEGNEIGEYGQVWKIPLCRTYKCSTAILVSSEKKEQAFKLIEILRTNHDYGNLLIYGVEDGEKEEIDGSALSNKLVFGLDDGLLQIDDGLVHFGSFDERADYYKKNVIVSPTMYKDFPPEYVDLYRIVNRYLGIKDSIIEHDNFEEELEKFKTEYSAALENLLEKMDK